MRANDELAVIDWLIGLFPVVPRRGSRLAFMFTDLEGFTAHAAMQGNGAALRLLRRHDSLVLPAIRALDGRIVKRLGDGLMAVFVSPADALRAAAGMLGAAIRRERTDEQLREAEARYRTLVEQVPAVIYIDAADDLVQLFRGLDGCGQDRL